MAEIVGVAATATQLATACFSLLDLIKKIKGGSSTLQRYHEQLQELRSLSYSISQNPLLQTTEVGTLTQYLLSVIDENCLATLLQKGRVLRTWGFIYKERDLLSAFATLERQKTNLSLLIEDIQARTLHQIQIDIRTMADNKPSRVSASPEKADTNTSHVAGNMTAGAMSVDTVEIEISREISLPSFHAVVNRPSPNNPNRNSSSSREYQRTQQPLQHDFGGQGGRWIGCQAGPDVTQINGIKLEVDAKDLATLSREPLKGVYHYDTCVKEGDGDQINGPDVSYYNDLTDPSNIVMNATYSANKKVPGPPTSAKGQGEQLNGGRMRKVEKNADVKVEK
ncbi:Fc.00g041670.m01.CDS01 [Cosmosporella sp. VM-42]